MPTASFTALPLATLTLTARLAPPPAGAPSEGVDQRPGSQDSGPDEPGSGEAG